MAITSHTGNTGSMGNVGNTRDAGPSGSRPGARSLPWRADASAVSRTLTSLLAAVLGLAAIAEVVLRSRVTLYSGDEIFNLDAALNLFRRGDYTTWQFGGTPFDPAISSGILATWVQGATMIAGANLYVARVTTGLLHVALVCTFGYLLLRDRGCDRRAALLTAIATWLAALPITAHELRIVNPGELWGFVYLAAGVVLMGSRPTLAALCCGLSVWLCKIIYAPFAAAMLLATWLASPRSGSRSLPPLAAAGPLALAFFAPLLAWMALIWLRYDATTVLGWILANAAFVVRHASGHALDVQGLPVLPGWRFEPQWPETSFLHMGSHVTLRSLLPLALGPTVRLVHAWLAATGRLEVAPNVRRVLDLACLTVVAFAVWFLGFDPTQWGRHLLPAIYVSLAVAVYCTADLATGLGARAPTRAATQRGSRAVEASAAVLLTAAVGYAGLYTVRSDQVDPWRPSYAKTCHAGGDLLQPPCSQERAREIIAGLTRDVCGYADRAFDQQCMRDRAQAFFARAVEVSRTDSGNPTWVYAGAYILLFVQGWAYHNEQRFLEDVTPAVCSQPNPLFREYLEQAGMDLDRILAGCRSVSIDRRRGHARRTPAPPTRQT